jgi:hypothetical protein
MVQLYDRFVLSRDVLTSRQIPHGAMGTSVTFLGCSWGAISFSDILSSQVDISGEEREPTQKELLHLQTEVN